MRRFASCLLVAGLAFVGAGCGASKKTVVYSDFGPVGGSPVTRSVPRGIRVGPGPFLFWGAGSGGQSGMFGDGGDGPHGTSVGCLDGRRYFDALGIQNGTKHSLRLIAANGPTPDPRIVDRVAIQLRLSPPYHPSAGIATSDLAYRRWSSAAAQPVTIPPHRIATVQRNFVLHNCHAIGEGQQITIPGSLVVRYRASGQTKTQQLAIPSRLVVVRGPTKHTCTPVSDSASLLTSDVSCAFARHAAPLCRTMHNGGWLGCTLDGTGWECGRFAGPGFPLFETCYLPHEKSHWFSVVWTARGLGLWGTIQNRRWDKGWRRLDAWHVTKGFCESRPAGMPLVFESSALRVVRAGTPLNARVRLVLHDFGGPGRWSAEGSTVQVLIGRHGATTSSYVATAGRVTIDRAAKDSVSGSVYANLRQKRGTKRAQLNGTWSCRVGTG